MKQLKQLFSDTIVYGISSVFARFINYLLVPMYTNVFLPEEYGVVGLVYVAIAFLQVLFMMGMESSYLRYAKDREEAPNVFKTVQGVLVGSSAVFLIFLWVFSTPLEQVLSLPRHSSILWIMAGILLADALAIVPFAELRLIRKSGLFAVLKLLNVLINIGLNFYLILFLNWGIEAVFVSNLAASVFSLLAANVALVHLYSGKWDTKYARTVLAFGLPFVPAGIGHVINEMIDRFYLKAMSAGDILSVYGEALSPEFLVGVYNACYKLAVFMLLLVQMYRMAWQPFFMRESDSGEAPQLFAKAFIVFNAAAAFLLVSTVIFLEEIVAIRVPGTTYTLIDSAYWAGLSIVPLLLMAYWMQGWYIQFSAGVFIKEQTKILPKITLIGASITLAANFFLVPVLGMMGAAWATFLSYGVMGILMYIHSQKAFNVPYQFGAAISIFLLSGGIIIAKPWVLKISQAYLQAKLVLLVASIILIALISFYSFIKAGAESK